MVRNEILRGCSVPRRGISAYAMFVYVNSIILYRHTGFSFACFVFRARFLLLVVPISCLLVVFNSRKPFEANFGEANIL